MKILYKEIVRLKNELDNYPVLLAARAQDLQPSLQTIGYFSPSGANWSYIVGYTRINGDVYQVVTQFGQIVGGKRVYIPENTVELEPELDTQFIEFAKGVTR